VGDLPPKWILIIPAIGMGGSFMAAVDHNAILSWIGAAVASSGFILNSVLSSYHRVREARRQEDGADRVAAFEAMQMLRLAQSDLESRILKGENDVINLTSRLDAVRCLFPSLDGKPRCVAEGNPPCAV